MDDIRSKSVIRAFVDLYNKGLIYRGVRMVNWDPKALTALSDEEVIFKDEHSKLFYLRYYLHEDDGTGATGAEGEVIHTDETGTWDGKGSGKPQTADTDRNIESGTAEKDEVPDHRNNGKTRTENDLKGAES